MEGFHEGYVLFTLHFTHFSQNLPISELETKVVVESEQHLIHEVARNVVHLTRFVWVEASHITDYCRIQKRGLTGKFEFAQQVVYFTCSEGVHDSSFSSDL